jgi:hypothetical protein
MRGRCLSWVKSRYWPMSKVSLLYPQQQTFQIQHYATATSQAIPLFGTYWGDHEDQLEMSVEVNVKTASALV